ncbi:sugar phosphate isomerase/epimerase [Pseudomonas silvicola]|nr:sugar phosphate isomerase/epimerase [Pseudomonas silvicola]
MRTLDRRLGVSSASLPSLSPERLIDELATQGYQGVEWRVADTHGISASAPWHARDNNRCTVAPDEASIQRIQRLCEAADLTIFALSPYLAVGDVQQAVRLIDLAALAGQARLRLWAPDPEQESYAQACARMRRFLDQIVPRAQASGVQLALEVHQRTICSSPSLAMRIAEHYPAQQLGIIYDMGNLAIEGRENVKLSLELMGAHLTHVQVKNVAYKALAPGQGWAWEWCPPDQGVLPLRQMLTTLRDSGFSDWVSIEDFCTTACDDVLKLGRNRALIRDYLGLDTPGTPTTAPTRTAHDHCTH